MNVPESSTLRSYTHTQQQRKVKILFMLRVFLLANKMQADHSINILPLDMMSMYD